MAGDSPLGKRFKDGDIIFKEKSIGKEMYVILSGKVKITKEMSGKATTIAALEERDFFGEMALFDNSPRSATAIALGDVNVLEIDQKNFLEKISGDPSLAFRMLKKMSQRIRETDERVLACITKIRDAVKDPHEFY